MSPSMQELPMYRQLYEDLRKLITDGNYMPGDLLPSENELCAEYGVTRPTVRKALDILTSDGFISRHQGKGSIVKGSPKSIGILSIMGTTSATTDFNLRTHIIDGPRKIEWDEAFTFPITEEQKQEGCIYFERLRLLNGTPVILDITMLPDTGLPKFMNYDLEDASLFDLLRTQYQIVPTGGVQQFFAIGADKRLHNLLNVRTGYPILKFNRKIETSRKGFNIFSQIFCVTQNYSLSGTF